MISENIQLAQYVAAKARKRFYGFTVEEMRSITYMALVRAADTFDPRFGLDFKAYATAKMQNEILDEIRNRTGSRLKHKRPHHIAYDDPRPQASDDMNEGSECVARKVQKEHRHQVNQVEERDHLYHGMTEFQQYVARMLVEGYSRVEIAEQLKVRASDVSTVIEQIVAIKGYAKEV